MSQSSRQSKFAGGGLLSVLIPGLIWMLTAAVQPAYTADQAADQATDQTADQTTAQTADQLQDTVGAALDTRRQTQQQLDDWSAEKAELVRRFRAAQGTVTWLEERRDEETARVTAVEARVAELRRRLDEAQRLEDSIADTLTTILDRLDASVDRSLPFLPQERQLRLSQLRRELVQPDVTAAEKLRRVLEALQVEAGYGGTVEIYQDQITVSGEELHVDILRLGRLALFWRTPDLQRVGHYDPAHAVWTELDDSYRRPVGAGHGNGGANPADRSDRLAPSGGSPHEDPTRRRTASAPVALRDGPGDDRRAGTARVR